MKAPEITVSLLLLLVTRSFPDTQAGTETVTQAEACAQIDSPTLPNTGSVRSGKLLQLHTKFVEAAKRVGRDAAGMFPGRTWTWQLDAEQSRERLDGFRRDLKALSDAESALEADLTPGERTKFRAQLDFMHELLQHVEADAQSLERELRRGHPTRWHVARDVSDMQREIRRLRKANELIAMGR